MRRAVSWSRETARIAVPTRVRWTKRCSAPIRRSAASTATIWVVPTVTSPKIRTPPGRLTDGG